MLNEYNSNYNTVKDVWKFPITVTIHLPNSAIWLDSPNSMG